MQSNIEEKQQYLRINILESGYKAEDFVEFLQQNEHVQQIDIEGWSMKKIKQLVQAYKQQKQLKYYTSKEDNENNNINVQGKQHSKMVVMKEKLKQFQEIKTKIQYERYQPLFDYQFKAKCKCVATDSLIKNLESDKQLCRVSIPNFQVKQTSGLFFGIGSKTQIYFTIQTNISKFTSKRLSEDFQWLSATLIRLYPIIALPQLSEFKKQNELSYQKRRVQLQQYMQHLSRRNALHRSSLFFDFLTASSQKMEKLKRSYDSIGFGKGVSLLKNQTGEIDIQLSRKNRQYEQSCFNYSKKVSLIHQNISQSFKKVNQSFSTVIEDLNQIVDYFADLHEAYNQLMNKFPDLNNRDYNEMLISINNLFHGISDNVKSHSQMISTHLKDYYKFNSSYDKNIVRLQKYINQQEKYYLQYKFQLHRKKERLFSEPEKWEVDLKKINHQQYAKDKQKAFGIMLSRQTKLQNDMKAWLAFLYTNFTKEFDIYLKQSTQRYAIKFKVLATDLLNKDKTYLQSITKFLTESRKLINSQEFIKAP